MTKCSYFCLKAQSGEKCLQPGCKLQDRILATLKLYYIYIYIGIIIIVGEL